MASQTSKDPDEIVTNEEQHVLFLPRKALANAPTPFAQSNNNALTSQTCGVLAEAKSYQAQQFTHEKRSHCHDRQSGSDLGQPMQVAAENLHVPELHNSGTFNQPPVVQTGIPTENMDLLENFFKAAHMDCDGNLSATMQENVKDPVKDNGGDGGCEEAMNPYMETGGPSEKDVVREDGSDEVQSSDEDLPDLEVARGVWEDLTSGLGKLNAGGDIALASLPESLEMPELLLSSHEGMSDEPINSMSVDESVPPPAHQSEPAFGTSHDAMSHNPTDMSVGEGAPPEQPFHQPSASFGSDPPDLDRAKHSLPVARQDSHLSATPLSRGVPCKRQLADHLEPECYMLSRFTSDVRHPDVLTPGCAGPSTATTTKTVAAELTTPSVDLSLLNTSLGSSFSQPLSQSTSSGMSSMTPTSSSMGSMLQPTSSSMGSMLQPTQSSMGATLQPTSSSMHMGMGASPGTSSSMGGMMQPTSSTMGSMLQPTSSSMGSMLQPTQSSMGGMMSLNTQGMGMGGQPMQPMHIIKEPTTNKRRRTDPNH